MPDLLTIRALDEEVEVYSVFLMPTPTLLVADKKQKIYDIPGYSACGQAGREVSTLRQEELIALPSDSRLFSLPQRYPVAFNIREGKYEELRDFLPLAAFLPPGYTSLLNAAYRETKGARILPLFAYSAVACYNGRFYAAATRVDYRKNHDLSSLDWKDLRVKVRKFAKTSNRLIKHLADCALVNRCPNAVNFFLGKYECPLPVSPVCNAGCLGCISFQPKGSCPATQGRLKFLPTAEEVAEAALRHIKAAVKPVVSFGQGCEGEPLLATGVIREVIRIIRSETPAGTIHMNTNASLPREVEALCRAGLDSMRVSLNSVREVFYRRYYSPRGYNFSDVRRSIAIAKKRDKFVSLNYLVMPGFTDDKDEFEELKSFIRASRVDMVQWRNLNYDPARYFRSMGVKGQAKLLGVKAMMERIKSDFPRLRQGYFNLAKEEFWNNLRDRT